jgi:uncharacterized protein (TIRG00374 family)
VRRHDGFATDARHPTRADRGLAIALSAPVDLVSWRRLVAWISGPLLAALFVWISFRGVDVDLLLAQIRQADPWLLALNVAAGPVILLLRAWRWRTLLRPVRADVPLREAYSATSIGYLAVLLPARVGEILRPALLSRRVGIPFAPTLATAGVERVILDLLMILLLGAVALVLPHSISGLEPGQSPEWMPRFRRISTVVLVLALCALAGIHWMGRNRARLAARLERWAQARSGRVVPAAMRWIATLLPGFAVLSTWGGLLLVMVQTLLIWAVTAAGMHAGLVACRLDVPAGAMLLLLPILAAGLSIPTPGNAGTFHFAMKLGLVSLFGVGDAAALGAGLVVHFCNWLPLVLIGGLCVASGGLRSGIPGPTGDGPAGGPDRA